MTIATKHRHKHIASAVQELLKCQLPAPSINHTRPLPLQVSCIFQYLLVSRHLHNKD